MMMMMMMMMIIIIIIIIVIVSAIRQPIHNTQSDIIIRDNEEKHLR